MDNHFNYEPSNCGKLPAAISTFNVSGQAHFVPSVKDEMGLRGRYGMRNEYDLRIDDTRNAHTVTDEQDEMEAKERYFWQKIASQVALLDDEGRD